MSVLDLNEGETINVTKPQEDVGSVVTLSDGSKIFQEPNKRWPTKVAKYKSEKRENGLIQVSTIGMGEPFPPDEGPSLGYGYEFVMVGNEEGLMVNILRELCEMSITDTNIFQLYQKYKIIPVDVEQLHIKYPEPYRTFQGPIGTLFGVSEPGFVRLSENSEGDEIVRIPVRVLTRRQTLAIRAGGRPRVNRLVSEFKKEKSYFYSIIQE